MSDFMQRYAEELARKKNTPLWVGLDPTIDHLPPEFRTGNLIADIERYLCAVIDIAAQYVVGVKPQFAYYEAMGPEGIAMMIRVIAYAKSKGLMVILDHKISDIGDTMEQYMEACRIYGIHAVTFVPYLGSTFLPEGKVKKAWLPWLEEGNGIIPMIMTSNDFAKQLQHLKLDDGRLVYQAMADLVVGWAEQVDALTNGHGMVGGVVGATYPQEAEDIRRRVGDLLAFLVPGYGAQGGVATEAVAGLSLDKIIRLFVNSSRGITLFSWWDKDTRMPKEGMSPLEFVERAIVNSIAEIEAAYRLKVA